MLHKHSVRIDRRKCVGCTNCIKSCPTEAIRVQRGKAKILDERCIDCGECLRVCPHHAMIAVTTPVSGLNLFKYNIVIPCAIQNEISLESAKNIIDNGATALLEGSNMPCTSEAVELLHHEDILYVPAKAANAGGVAVSGLEMAQNAGRSSWSYEKVDRKLKDIMLSIFDQCYDASQAYGATGNLVLGANITHFTPCSVS